VRCLLVYQYTGHHFWKVDGILSGLEPEALDYLLPGLYLSEYHIDESLFLNFIFHAFVTPMRNVIIFIVAIVLHGNPNFNRVSQFEWQLIVLLVAGDFLQIWLICPKWTW
jgi:hypothetical protein